MSDTILASIKLLFIIGFTLHNLEEAIWLPKWSFYAKKFHKPVNSNGFIFAVIIITIIGYLLTGLELIYGNTGNLINIIYLGFVGMMGLNSIFPHLLATIVIKKYSPGLVTGLLLNLTFSIIILREYIAKGIDIITITISIISVSIIILLLLKPLFKIGDWLINY